MAREEESARISTVLETVSEGAGRTLFLAGEPGIGKTRLAQEACMRARDLGFLVAAGRCYEATGGAPFYPFLEALSMLFEAAPRGVRDGVSERWPYLTRLLPDHFPSRSGPPPESAEELRWLFRAVAGFVREAAGASPVAFLFDDLHWADGASIDLLAHLSRHTGGDPILIVGTFRDAEAGRGHPLRRLVSDLGREGVGERIFLPRFGKEDTASLVGERLGGRRFRGSSRGSCTGTRSGTLSSPSRRFGLSSSAAIFRGGRGGGCGRKSPASKSPRA